MSIRTIPPRLLIAGIGNIFLGDDAFGVEVVRRLMQQTLPEDVRVVDFGIRGFDLACALLDGCDAAILVDAAPRGGPPGTLYLIEPDVGALAGAESSPLLQAHSLDPMRVLQYVQAMGGRLPRLRLVGCEPASFGSDQQPQLALSPAVAEAVERAVAMLQELVWDLSREILTGHTAISDWVVVHEPGSEMLSGRSGGDSHRGPELHP